MAKYTYEDIIMDPEDPRLEGAIGKECYVSDFPKIALNYAINNLTTDRLKRIAKEETCPFVNEEEESNWAVIIIKKEEPKPKYVPFKNGLEFFNSYLSVESRLEKTDYFLSNHGIWLKDKDIDGVSYIVTEIWRDGVVLGSDQHTTIWKDLLDGYAFIDNTPCGRFVKESEQ